MNLIVAERRLELARSPDLRRSVHQEQVAELKGYLDRFVLEIMQVANLQFCLTWRSEWVLEVADTTGAVLTTLLVIAPAQGALDFAYTQEDGRTRWVGLYFTLYPSSLAGYGWVEKDDDKKVIVTIAGVASLALGRLLRYATLTVEQRLREQRY